MGPVSLIALSVGCGLLYAYATTEDTGSSTTFGSASWLPITDALLKGFFKRRGILLGDWVGLLETYYDDTHAITFGPAGSGKGTSAIVSNLLTTRFAFLNDPGGENTAIAIKAWRDKGFEVVVINPFGMFTEEPWSLPQNGFNPLDILDPDDPQFAAHAELVAEMLTPRGGRESGSSQFFKDTAQGFKQAVIIFMKVSLPKADQHLGTLYKLCNLPAADWEKLLSDMQACTAADGMVAAEASAMARREAQAPEEFSAIMSTVQQDLRWLADPLVRQNLKRSDVDFSALKGCDRTGRPIKGCIIAVVLPLEYNETHAAIPRLAMGCAIWTMQRAPLAREKVLFIIDEAAALQKIARFPNWLATLRKYRTVLWPIFQNIGQVKALYGEEWQTFIANCGLRQFLGASDLQTAEYVHRLLGEHTTHTIAVNHKGEESRSEAKRSLMTVDEILYFDADQQIVFCGNSKPMLLNKTRYWERPELRRQFNRNPYMNTRTPFVWGTGFKKLVGRIAYGFAWAFAPHPMALTFYVCATIAIGVYAYQGMVN